MSSHVKNAVNTAKHNKKSKGVWGSSHYATYPTGTIKTHRQVLHTKDALSAVISQLKERSGEKFLSENDPGDNNP